MCGPGDLIPQHKERDVQLRSRLQAVVDMTAISQSAEVTFNQNRQALSTITDRAYNMMDVNKGGSATDSSYEQDVLKVVSAMYDARRKKDDSYSALQAAERDRRAAIHNLLMLMESEGYSPPINLLLAPRTMVRIDEDQDIEIFVCRGPF